MKTPRKTRRPRTSAKASIRERDPFLGRERTRYERPLPSREFILQVLEEQGVPVAEAKLARLLDISEAEEETFSRRLAAMERDAQIIRNRKNAICVVGKLDLIAGTVQGHPGGFGFLLPDAGGEDLYLSPAEMKYALHGDRVLTRIVGTSVRGKPEATIVEVIERANRNVVGRFL
ncbi:MAG TPA: ribonuclease R, partial [Burkholderiales bacterium]|nr:ribonuclease R [Burkholderiales bacterium]